MNKRSIFIIFGIIYFIWCAWLFYQFPKLPHTIPTHFNPVGEVDGGGSRAMIWTLPAISLFVTIITLIIPQYAKNMINYPVKITEENREKQYQLVLRFLTVIAFIALGLFIYISWITVQVAMSGESNSPYMIGVWILIGVLFASIAWYFGKAIRLK